MEKVKKYALDLQKAKKYFENHIDNVNTLCKELINSINFDKGSFFSLLSSDIDESLVNEFSYFMRMIVNSKEALNNYSSRNTLVEFIADKMSGNNISCIFDDVLQTEKNNDLFKTHGVKHEDQIYYLY